ncbi:MAG: asparaginase [Saprospiraceae bacterium]|nr:asparaginase [Saprospiraceae bacterium]
MVSNADQPKILILTTGGTIASTGESPMLDGARLIQEVPDLAHYAEIEVEEFSRMGSSKITPSHWLKLSQLINDRLQSGKYQGVVITHGTDTMEETAYFLHLTIQSKLPVVLTGAMRPSDRISADGPANLIAAVRVAGHAGAINQGVLIVLNDMISSARDTWKTDDLRLQSFQSPQFGHLGVVDSDTVLFYRGIVHPHTSSTNFDIAAITELPEVDLVSDFTGMNSEILDFYSERASKGFVLQTFAGGRTSSEVLNGLEAVAMNKPVVIASRVPMGRIPNPSPYSEAVLISQDLPANKARILLMLALTLTDDRKEIQKILNTY